MANEKRLINQKVMEKQIKEVFKTSPYLMGQMLRWVRSLPKVDAVEVVRCKDCKHWNEQEQECEHWYGFRADNFCSYGERREGE